MARLREGKSEPGRFHARCRVILPAVISRSGNGEEKTKKQTNAVRSHDSTEDGEIGSAEFRRKQQGRVKYRGDIRLDILKGLAFFVKRSLRELITSPRRKSRSGSFLLNNDADSPSTQQQARKPKTWNPLCLSLALSLSVCVEEEKIDFYCVL